MRIPLAIPLVAACALSAFAPAFAAPPDRPDPVPIPGGLQVPGGPLVHVFAPGPPAFGFMGLDVDPSTITNFNGFSMLAYLGGTATDADGHPYDLQADMRAYRGTYVAADGTTHQGTFGFV
jgi:hypothetical protein